MVSAGAQLGVALRKIRRDHRLSLRRVAEQAEISVATLSRIETNKQSVDVELLLRLADIFGVTAGAILGEGNGEDDDAHLARLLRGLGPDERARLLLDSLTARREPKSIHATMDGLISTIDLLRAELLVVQRKINRRGKR